VGDRHPKISDNVLIGACATVLGNITVGRGAQIAAGSLVLKPVPPHTMVAGSPAKEVGKVAGEVAPWQGWRAMWEGLVVDAAGGDSIVADKLVAAVQLLGRGLLAAASLYLTKKLVHHTMSWILILELCCWRPGMCVVVQGTLPAGCSSGPHCRTLTPSTAAWMHSQQPSATAPAMALPLVLALPAAAAAALRTLS
jgi:hypothetical protein